MPSTLTFPTGGRRYGRKMAEKPRGNLFTILKKGVLVVGEGGPAQGEVLRKF